MDWMDDEAVAMTVPCPSVVPSHSPRNQEHKKRLIFRLVLIMNVFGLTTDVNLLHKAAMHTDLEQSSMALGMAMLFEHRVGYPTTLATMRSAFVVYPFFAAYPSLGHSGSKLSKVTQTSLFPETPSCFNWRIPWSSFDR